MTSSVGGVAEPRIHSAFRASKSLAQRTSLSAQVRTTNAGKIPVIVELDIREGNGLRSLPRIKYLVSARAPGTSLRDAILADAELPLDTPLRLFLCQTGAELEYAQTLGIIDTANKDSDGLLYVAAAMQSGAPAAAGSVPGSPAAAPSAGASAPAAGAEPATPEKRPVPYIQGLLEKDGSSGGSGAASLVSPHGDLAPEGATIASCTFLNPRASGRLNAPTVPTCNGRVPPSIYLAVLLDVTAVGLVIPLLATYSRSLGAGPRFTGVLQATYGLAQLIGANIFGGLSDSLGRRALLLLSCTGGVLGYVCLAISVGPMGSLPLLLASRLPIGLLKQSLTVSRALVVDTTPANGRLRPMSRLGGCVGIGFVLGPAFGGILSKVAGLYAPPLLAACLFTIAALVVATLLPETAPLPLSVAELRRLLTIADTQWKQAVAADGTDGSLDVARASALCPGLLERWAPNGQPVPASERAELLSAWNKVLQDQLTGNKRSVPWAAFCAALAQAYAGHKLAKGMLPADAEPALAAVAAARSRGPRVVLAGSAFGGLRDIVQSSRKLWTSRSMPQVRRLLLARALVELAVMMLHATFADFTRLKFGWDQKRTGYGMALSGALSVAVDMLVLPALHSRRLLAELPAGLGGGALVAFGLLSISLARSTRGFFLGLTLLSLGASLFKSALSTLVMGCARRDEAGTISGAMDMMEAVCRVAAPLAGGLLIEHASLEGPQFAGSLLALSGVVLLYEVAPAEHRAALLRHGIRRPPDGKKLA